MYWFSEWLKNTIHTTISGVYGSWYFHPHNTPRGATRGALKRSLTYSFGSISLGSLLVAIINFLRQMCSIAQQSEAGQGNIVVSLTYPGCRVLSDTLHRAPSCSASLAALSASSTGLYSS